MPYCSHADLYAHGVPRGATPNPGRVVASAVNNTITLDEHGFETGDAILLRPAGTGALPVELSEGVTYYAQAETEHAFKLRATPGGSALVFTNAADPLLVIAPLNRDAAIEWASRIIDDMVPGQAVPFDDVTLYPAGVPSIIRMTTAELAAGKLLAVIGAASTSLAQIVDFAQKRLTRWSEGLPLRGTPDASRANVPSGSPAQTSATIAPSADPRGWRRYGGLN